MSTTELPDTRAGARRVAGYEVRQGRPLPFGASRVPGGVNFSVYSNNATSMTLVLYQCGEAEPFAELPIPDEFRIGGTYAMTVHGIIADNLEYGYRADGPFDPDRGLRFDRSQVLSDPYATVLNAGDVWGAPRHGEEAYRYRASLPRTDFEWDGDRQLGTPMADLVIYELHVRGYTRHPSSGVEQPGTYAGLAEKIPYLKELGVNCVELMPVFQFDENDTHGRQAPQGARLFNYWGYSTVGFFAPNTAYAAGGQYGRQVDEFKDLVKQLHKAGIEVILDVVFNHTAEGDERGPTISFRGLDNSTYYMLTPEGYYYNFSGTGNTLNCNQPVVRGFVLDCLRYWVSEFHVDGFRFDLASILDRAPDGTPLPNPPLLETLAADPILRDTKLIAEAWDAGGLYQVGSFPDYCRWSEWNGKFRDTVRRFLKGDTGFAGELATRLLGSPDLYARRGPTASINFVTAHDGFTLNDLVSYDHKHNEANGEDNRDGDNGNHSWNCGIEGPTDDPGVLELRARQVRNALLLLLCSHGVPMLLAGDELGRTQHGNNNAYCQDELSWVDWTLADAHADLHDFTRKAIAFRKAHPALRRRRHATGLPGETPFPAVSWHGVRAGHPDWSPHCRLVAAMLTDSADCVYLAANTHWEAHEVELPAPPTGTRWHVFANTGIAGAGAAHEPGAEPVLAGQSHLVVGPRSVVVLCAHRDTQDKPRRGDA